MNKLVEDDPPLALVTGSEFRNGLYIASSRYNVALSFGEFGEMIAPIGGYFLLHGEKWRERVLGAVVLVSAVLTLFFSGSRGASIAFLVAMALLAGLWIARKSRTLRHTLFPMIGGVTTVIGTIATVGLVLGSGTHAKRRGRRRRLGRRQQWASRTMADGVAAYFEQSNHGAWLGDVGSIIDWHLPGVNLASVASYVLGMLVETAVPGLLFNFVIIVLATGMSMRIYLNDSNTRTALAGPLACTFFAYGIYGVFLSQQENQTLFFLLVAMAFVLAKLSSERAAATTSSVQGLRPAGRRPYAHRKSARRISSEAGAHTVCHTVLKLAMMPLLFPSIRRVGGCGALHHDPRPSTHEGRSPPILAATLSRCFSSCALRSRSPSQRALSAPMRLLYR